MGKMRFRAVLFDLDDTPVDTSGTHADRASRIASILEKERPDVDRHSFVSRLLTPRDGATAGLIVPLLDELGIAGTPLGNKVHEMWFFQGCLDLVRPFPGATQALRELARTYILGAITNGLEYRQRAKFESLLFHKDFQVFLSSEAAGSEKPAQEIFHQALDRIEVTPAEAVYVGDRLDTDIGGARQAGLAAILFDHQGRVPTGVGPTPDATFASFDDLPAVMHRLEGARVD